MGELLLITDDPRRGARLARDLGTFRACRVLDLYEDAAPSATPELIVTDVAHLTSEAVQRLRRVVRQVRGADEPLLFLLHGDSPRIRAQAVALGASSTLSAASATRMLMAALDGLYQRGNATQSSAEQLVSAEQHAAAARRFLDHAFADRPMTPAVIDTGTGLIARAVREAGVHDWVRAVRRFDDATHQHCLLIAGLAASFAQHLGLAAADGHHLTKAALLHDVGKLRVPREILNKPGPLTDAEWAVMRTHPVRGHAMLAHQGFADELLAVVRSHHEMLDGTGYPDGLKGAEIPDLVRLITICDIYGALIERRPYKPPLAGDKAYALLSSMTGRLDGDLVRAFRPVAAAFGAPVSRTSPWTNP